ncbi:MAG: pilus (MSHA type) biogenesis protein MshL [Halorhodospira sp.]
MTAYRQGWGLALLLMLSACAVTEEEPKDRAQRAQDWVATEAEREAAEEADAQADPEAEAPPEELEALLSAPPETDPLALQAEEPRFDISADDVPVEEFFHGLVEDTPYNVAVHPDVEGKISLSLNDVSVPEVMEIVRDTYGYAYQRTDAAYQILPAAQLESRLFELDYLNINRTGESGSRIAAGGVTASEEDGDGGGEGESGATGSRLSTESQSQLWSDIETIVRRIIAREEGAAAGEGDEGDEGDEAEGDEEASGEESLPGGASVVASPAAGTLAVRATPSALAQVERFMERLQRNLNRQVVLEARIVEVELNDDFKAGIQWEAIGSDGGRDLRAELDSGAVGQGSEGTFGLDVISQGSFDAALNALERQGDVQVLSAPRVSTLNSQKALIKVGTDAYFQTDVDIDTQIQDNETLTEVDPTFDPFFSGIALDVTPSINEGDWITLHVQPSVTQVTEVPRSVETGEDVAEFQLAESDVRQTDSIVRARDDEIIVIGGLIEERTEQETQRVPLLGRIPLLGWLFANERQETEQVELAILLRPRVVDEQTWAEEVDAQMERIDGLYEQP